jgi:hypothetical protein
MEGKSDLLDCFYRLRLGRKAINHAKSLKRSDLVDWLASSRSHALLDNDPVILPDYREMIRVIQSFQRGYTQLPPQLSQGYTTTTEITPELPPEATENQGFQVLEAGFSESPESLLERILAAFDDEKSDDWIAKNIFGATGGNSYYKAKDRIAKIRARWEGN